LPLQGAEVGRVAVVPGVDQGGLAGQVGGQQDEVLAQAGFGPAPVGHGPGGEQGAFLPQGQQFGQAAAQLGLSSVEQGAGPAKDHQAMAGEALGQATEGHGVFLPGLVAEAGAVLVVPGLDGHLLAAQALQQAPGFTLTLQTELVEALRPLAAGATGAGEVVALAGTANSADHAAPRSMP